jgi:hypothetical protein
MHELLTALRYRSEGTDIDFKSTQYRFIGGDEEDKAEMLKDILAMANAWRDGPAYILLGFKDQRPQPAEVVGILSSIDDAKVQQFVHGKVKPKLTFSYEEHVYEGKTVGIIKIPKQKRPFYLSHPYGKLKSNVVYVRRGSSTDEAEPPEIASMTNADAGRTEIHVRLDVLTANNQPLPDLVPAEYLRFIESFPDYKSPEESASPFTLYRPISLVRDNRNFWREYGEFARIQASQILLRFVLHNLSAVQLSNAKIEVCVEPLDGEGLQLLEEDQLPEAPHYQFDPVRHMPNISNLLAHQGSALSLDKSGPVPICHIRFGSLLPGEEGRSSEMLALIPLGPGKIRLRSRILASELPIPLESERIVESRGEVKHFDFDGFFDFVRDRLGAIESDADHSE